MKLKMIWLLLGTILLSACRDTIAESQERPSADVTNAVTVSDTDHEVTDGRVDVAVSLDKKIKLYPLYKKESRYGGFILEANNVQKEFNWKSSALKDEKPQVFSVDLTQNGKKEAIVILNQGKGTGLHIQEVHAVNLESMSEIPIENPEKFISQNMTSVIKPQQNVSNITVKIKGEHPIVYPYLFDSAGHYFEALRFGAVHYYSVENEKLVYKVAGALAFQEFFGSAEVAYTYDKERNQLRGKSIVFDPEWN